MVCSREKGIKHTRHKLEFGREVDFADYLSRNPIWDKESEKHGPWITDDFGKEITIEAHVCAAQAIKRYHDRIKSDPLLKEMRDSGPVDEQYTEVIKAITRP